MIPFTERCKLRVLVKNKPRLLGLQNYVFATSDDLMLYFELYFPDNSVFSDKGPAMILGLAKNVPANSCLYFDRYFNRIPFLDLLREMQLHGTGTIMFNRVLNHKKLDLKKDQSMKRREFTSQDVASVKWKDNRAILMIFNCTGGNQTSFISR